MVALDIVDGAIGKGQRSGAVRKSATAMAATA